MKLLKLNLRLFFCVLFSSYSYSGDFDLKYLSNIKSAISPENTLIAFDLHDVIFRKIHKIMTYKALLLISKGMYWYLLNPFFWHKAINISKEDLIWEDFYYKLIEHYPYLAKLKEDFYDISNAIEPIEETLEIIKELKSKKYKIFLLSNIGKDTYDRLIMSYKEIFSLFDGLYISSPENNYIHKPQDQYYIGFKKYLENLNFNYKNIIFIDDIEENISVADKHEISGIVFKDPSDLNFTLKHLNIF